MGSDELVTFADIGIFFNFCGEVFKKYRLLLRKIFGVVEGGGLERGFGTILTFTDGGGGRGPNGHVSKSSYTRN